MGKQTTHTHAHTYTRTHTHAHTHDRYSLYPLDSPTPSFPGQLPHLSYPSHTPPTLLIVQPHPPRSSPGSKASQLDNPRTNPNQRQAHHIITRTPTQTRTSCLSSTLYFVLNRLLAPAFFRLKILPTYTQARKRCCCYPHHPAYLRKPASTTDSHSPYSVFQAWLSCYTLERYPTHKSRNIPPRLTVVSPIPLLPVSLLRISLAPSLSILPKKRNQNLACLLLGYLSLTHSLARSIYPPTRLACYPLPEQGLVIRNRAEFQYCPSNIVASKDKRSRNYSLSPTTQGRPTITLNQPASPTHPTPHGIPAARYLVLGKISDTTRTFRVYSALTVDYPSFSQKGIFRTFTLVGLFPFHPS